MAAKIIDKISSLFSLRKSSNDVRLGEKDGVSAILELLDREKIYPKFLTIELGVNEPICRIGGREYLMFCSNNYLGITQNEKVKNAAKESIDKYGVGPGGSRVVSGNVDIIEQLEQKIADFTGNEACLVFPTGYMANVSIFQAVMDPLIGDFPYSSDQSVIFSDEYNHGSIIDGIRLSRARRVIFKHNDLVDLRKKLKANNLPNKLIVTESVFSTEGEIINIPEYISLAKETGSKIMVDDAHGIGVLGKNGGGVSEHFSCQGDIDILMGSMDKALGGTGGYLCGTKELIKFLRVSCRSSILSSSLPTVSAASMFAAIDIIKSSAEERRVLFESSEYVRNKLKEMGFVVLGHDILPAVPLFLGEERLALEFNERLFGRGIFSMVFRWPAVQEGKSRLRITIMANHTKDNLEALLDACLAVGKELKIIK